MTPPPPFTSRLSSSPSPSLPNRISLVPLVLRITVSKIQLPLSDKINTLLAETDTPRTDLTDIQLCPGFRAAPAATVAEPG
jgi:hypothetical protein